MEPTLRRRHRMPFGTELTGAGAVRFRLWAPGAQRVELVLGAAGAADGEPLAPLGDGWFELESARAHVGSLYRYRIDGGIEVPDPASRFNPQGVHAPSEVIDPEAYAWSDQEWQAPPWHASVIYELHVGTFNAPGTYAAVKARLPHLARLGVAAIELMPLAAFAGARGWGYDGVLQFAPHAAYGRPEDLKALIAAAHRHGLAVILDVVYNHFGPEGNYLHAYAPQFFNERHTTPWGAAINFDGPHCRAVRDFFIHNALYWLNEYHLDGLRLDAIHAVRDGSEPHIVNELAQTARTAAARTIYLTLENLDNAVRFLGLEGGARTCDAQWNDDAHHCLHVLLTGETQDYYTDYRDDPHALLCRALSEGFAYQGQLSPFAGAARGQRSTHLPPSAFINFLQNHDQIGNRIRGERLRHLVQDPAALRAATAVLLLAPAPPLIFMGDEWGADEPFPWFCDFEPQLQEQVRLAREREFPGGADPGSPATFASACLDWGRRTSEAHARVLVHYRRLLTIRRRDIVPLIPTLRATRCSHTAGQAAFAVDWMAAEHTLHLIANLGAQSVPMPAIARGRVIFATHPGVRAAVASNTLAPWSVLWLLENRRDGR
jgi:maltooligosyltrehalose trehalohydrolase